MSYRIENCEAQAETDKALKVKLPSGKSHWIPKSWIDDDSEVYNMKDGKEGVLVVSDWFAEREELV